MPRCDNSNDNPPSKVEVKICIYKGGISKRSEVSSYADMHDIMIYCYNVGLGNRS